MSDIATLLEAIAALVAALFWPGLVLAALFLFKREIRDLLSRVRRGVIMGQEIELNELGRSVAVAEEEVAALPRREADELESQTAEGEDAIRQVFDEATKSPKAALLVLASEIERETRELVAAIGLSDNKRYVPVHQAVQMLQRSDVLPEYLLRSVDQFWNVRNRLVHGRDATVDDTLRAIDSGATILRALQAIPRETHIVYHPGVEVFADPDAKQPREGVRGIVLETQGSDGTAMRLLRMFPATKSDYQQGKRVAWEWNTERVFGASWYRDQDTQEVKKAWDSAAEFVGRHVDEIP
jgi:hypothetical protein